MSTSDRDATTQYGTFETLTPDAHHTITDYVTVALEGASDTLDRDTVTTAYRDAINASLPTGVTLDGNDVYGPYHGRAELIEQTRAALDSVSLWDVVATLDSDAPAAPQPTSSLAAALLPHIEQYEREHAAANSSPTVATLLNLAESYARATTDAHREHLAADVAEKLSLAEAGTIRRAAEAVRLGTPGIICRARARGMEPNEIARQLGATGSYVRRILRDNPTLLAEAVKAREAADRPTA